jgi:hypothetical protein
MEVSMLFFKGKKEKISDDTEEKVVRAPRYDSFASIRVNGFEGEALLKNISITGFCMESKTFANLRLGEKYLIQVTPESTAGLVKFEVEVEVRWVRSEVSKFDVGLQLTKTQSHKDLEKYINFLKLKTSAF